MLLVTAMMAALMAQPSGSRTKPLEEGYRFELNEERVIGFFRKTKLLVGTFDEDGEFHQITSVTAQPITDGISGIRYSGPKFQLICAEYQAEKCSVYELRSARLIPGMYRPEGLFVPELGGKIIDFKDYNYSDKAIPIWNLPGKFVKR